MFIFQFIIIILSIIKPPSVTNNVEVTVSGVRNKNGYILISVFKNQTSFENEKPSFTAKFDKKNMVQGFLIAKFNLDAGIYGFALLDDENNDSKMNYNFVGIPKEGFGFSNYYHTGFTKPKLELFKLEVQQEQVNKSKIKIRYM